MSEICLAKPRCSPVPAPCKGLTCHGKVTVQGAYIRPGTLLMFQLTGHDLCMCISAEEVQDKNVSP